MALLVLTLTVTGCENARIVEIGQDTYLASASSAAGAFADRTGLQAGVIEDANTFAAKHGKVVIGLSVDNEMPAMGFPSCTYKFLAITPEQAQRLAQLQAESRAQQQKEWVSLTPAQRMEFSLQEQEIQQQQQAMQLNAAESASAQSQALSNQMSYDERTRAMEQPVNVNVNHSGYIDQNVNVNGTLDVYQH